MENTPLSSIKVSDRLHKKLQLAVQKSGMPVADVRRHALNLGLDALARINYDVDGFLSASIEQLHTAEQQTARPPLRAVKDAKRLKEKS